MKLTDRAREIFNAGLRAIYNDEQQRDKLGMPPLMQPPEVDFIRTDLPEGSLAIQVGWDEPDGAPVMLRVTEPDDGPMVMSNDGGRGVRGLVKDALNTILTRDDYADVTVPPEDASDLMYVANEAKAIGWSFEKRELRGPGLCLRFRDAP